MTFHKVTFHPHGEHYYWNFSGTPRSIAEFIIGDYPGARELGKDPLPAGAEDIRGKLIDPAPRVFCHMVDGKVEYFGVFEYVEPAIPQLQQEPLSAVVVLPDQRDLPLPQPVATRMG